MALKAREADAGSAQDTSELIENQYKGKEQLLPLYNRIITEVKSFGNDVTVAPKKASVSLRRKKQLALLTLASKSRFEIGINLKGQAPKGKLEVVTSANAICSHRINLSGEKGLDKEVFSWIKEAYENAG